MHILHEHFSEPRKYRDISLPLQPYNYTSQPQTQTHISVTAEEANATKLVISIHFDKELHT